VDVVHEVQHVIGGVGAARVEGATGTRARGVSPVRRVCVRVERVALHVAVQDLHDAL